MRESISSTFLYNVIITFLLITFAFLAGTLSYTKAFKASNKIANALEKYEGYNVASDEEINNMLNTLGYKQGTVNCPARNGMEIVPKIASETSVRGYRYCLYKRSDGNNDYYTVLTYMYFDFPLISEFSIPLYSKTKKIYRFSFPHI